MCNAVRYDVKHGFRYGRLESGTPAVTDLGARCTDDRDFITSVTTQLNSFDVVAMYWSVSVDSMPKIQKRGTSLSVFIVEYDPKSRCLFVHSSWLSV